jgi:hypothetical protein
MLMSMRVCVGELGSAIILTEPSTTADIDTVGSPDWPLMEPVHFAVVGVRSNVGAAACEEAHAAQAISSAAAPIVRDGIGILISGENESAINGIAPS